MELAVLHSCGSKVFNDILWPILNQNPPITGVNVPSLPFNHSDYLHYVSEPDLLLLTHAGSHLPLDRQMPSNASRENVLLRDFFFFFSDASSKII